MRVGATIFNQNYNDWDRYEAEEKGQSVRQAAGQVGPRDFQRGTQHRAHCR